MAGNTRVRSVETLACDAGWRNYHFVKVTTEDGVVGYSEFDEGFGSPGLGDCDRTPRGPRGRAKCDAA
jgi:galactonate dehydratase